MPLPSVLPLCNRNTIQVKTHAQVELSKLDKGVDIFEPLDLYLQEEKDFVDEGGESVPSDSDENFQITDEDDVFDFDQALKKTPKKNTKTPEKKKSAKKSAKKTPKEKTGKVQVDPVFVVTPRTAAKHNAKTPVISNKSASSAVAKKSTRSVTSKAISAAKMAATYPRVLPYQPTTRSVGFHPMTMTGTLPPTFFHFPLPPLPKVSAPPAGPSRQGPGACKMGFGLYEAASALLDLSGACHTRSGSLDAFASYRR